MFDFATFARVLTSNKLTGSVSNALKAFEVLDGCNHDTAMRLADAVSDRDWYHQRFTDMAKQANELRVALAEARDRISELESSDHAKLVNTCKTNPDVYNHIMADQTIAAVKALRTAYAAVGVQLGLKQAVDAVRTARDLAELRAKLIVEDAE